MTHRPHEGGCGGYAQRADRQGGGRARGNTDGSLGPPRRGSDDLRDDADIRQPRRAVLRGDRSDGRAAGELPQAFTHLSLINAAINLDFQLDHGPGWVDLAPGALRRAAGTNASIG